MVSRFIDTTVNSGVGNSYYWARNTRFSTNRNYANGKIDMQRFMDMLDFNGKFNYVNINWNCIKLGARIVAGLVGRMMEREEKIQINCIDSLSVTEKNDRYEELGIS